VREIAKRLQKTGLIIPPRVNAGEVKVVGAHYSLDTAKIELLK